QIPVAQRADMGKTIQAIEKIPGTSFFAPSPIDDPVKLIAPMVEHVIATDRAFSKARSSRATPA
ncbi:MAG: DUF2274 domain-containing protein, partial [Proteobacteria bacterium]|nr:DUF2274 domain-containing protein [Pseudomonadota bacterium]